LEYLTISLLFLNVAISFYAFHKVRRIHLAVFDLHTAVRHLGDRQLIDLHQQAQELNRLQFMLGLAEPLPATRGWAASPDFLRLVAEHILSAKPQTLVELGSGTSSIVIARTLELNGTGHLYSYDHDPYFAEQTRQNLRRYGLSDWATVIDAPLRPYQINNHTWKWYSIPNWFDRAIDLLIIDGPPEPTGPLARYPAGPILFPKLANNATVFLDDADRPDERKILEQWQLEFPLSVVRPRTEKGCAILRLKADASQISAVSQVTSV
jgi:hypothetical protein